jgi:AcrR family transcriptional regulator
VDREIKARSTPGVRRYDSPVRRARALETERRITEAAATLFTELGYVGTSLAAVADRAEVDPRTLYKVFGTKVGLLSRLVDIAIVGDQDAVPVAARSWAVDAFGADTGRERVIAFATVVRHVMASAGWAFRIAAQAAATDADAGALWAAGQRHRLDDATKFVRSLRRADLLRRDRSSRDAVGTVWLVSSPETFIQLTDGFGWTLGRYEHWVERILADALLEPPNPQE